jgi:hypothetical protein
VKNALARAVFFNRRASCAIEALRISFYKKEMAIAQKLAACRTFAVPAFHIFKICCTDNVSGTTDVSRLF